MLKPQAALFTKWLWRRVQAGVVAQDETVAVVRTCARLSQSPVTRRTAVVGTGVAIIHVGAAGHCVQRAVAKDGCYRGHVLESLCRVLSVVEAQTFSMLR